MRLSELDFFLETMDAGGGFDDPSMRHLASPLSVRDYMRIADDTRRAMRGRRLLDWGCGYGQLSHLLTSRGLDVTSYDVSSTIEHSHLARARQVKAVQGRHPHWLPFRSGAFDAVLACGVLEHVPDMGRSLDEIRRVLVRGGQLFVFNLPQRWSYKELVIERLHLGYAHDRRFTKRSAQAMLERHGFRVRTVGRAGAIPHLATGLSPGCRRIYYRAAPSLFKTDRVLSKAPVLNWIAQSLEIVAESTGGPDELPSNRPA